LCVRGVIQIMSFWVRVIGDGDPGKLFHMQTNLRFGCVILRHYLDREHGDMFMALGRYNGSRGKPQYPNAVFAAQRHWEYVDHLPAASTPFPPPAPAAPYHPAPIPPQTTPQPLLSLQPRTALPVSTIPPAHRGHSVSGTVVNTITSTP